jgi:hypothetical protein
MTIGVVRIYDKVNRCGCVQDSDTGAVYFFDRRCFPAEHLPHKGDRVTFILRSDARSGQTKAYLTQAS